MNSLKTDINGGLPWVLDDFRFHHDQTREALTAIILGLNIDGLNCRLQGVIGTWNGSTWDVSAGYLFINGEVVRVDAQTGLADTDAGFDYYYVTVSETFDAAGLKSLEDGGTADTYKKRRGIINANGANPVGADLKITMSGVSGGDLFSTLASIVANSGVDTPWITVNATSLSVNTGTIVEGTFSYRTVNGRIEVSFNMGFTFGAINSFTLTMPASVITGASFNVLISYSDSDSFKVAHVAPNGSGSWNFSRDAAEGFAAGSVNVKGEFSYKM